MRTPGLSSTAALALRAPWQWQRNAGGRWTRWLARLAMPVSLGIATAVLLAWVPGPHAWMLLALLYGAALLSLWGRQMAALLQLDHPHAARLVPGHGRALRGVALGLWLALTALVAIVAAAAALGLAGDARTALRWLLLAAIGAGAAMLFVALALRWWPLWALVWLLPIGFGLPAVAPGYALLAAAARAHWQASPWLCTALAMLAMGAGLASVFGRGDARHARSYAGRERLRKLWEAGAAGQKPTLDAWGRWGAWLGTPWRRLAEAWFAHVVARATPQRASVLDRAEVALHGPQHWVRQLGALLPMLLVAAVALPVAASRSGDPLPEVLRHGSAGLAIGLMSMVMGPLIGLSGALWVSRREQALLMLLPGMPQGSALNRALAWRHTRSFLLLWALTLPLFIGLAITADAAHVMAFPAVVLPMVAWLWRDVARQRAPQAWTAAAPYLVCLVLGLGSLVLMRERSGAWWPWLAGLLMVSVPWMLWRWRRLSRLPQGLPAGRLA